MRQVPGTNKASCEAPAAAAMTSPGASIIWFKGNSLMIYQNTVPLPLLLFCDSKDCREATITMSLALPPYLSSLQNNIRARPVRSTIYSEPSTTASILTIADTVGWRSPGWQLD